MEDKMEEIDNSNERTIPVLARVDIAHISTVRLRAIVRPKKRLKFPGILLNWENLAVWRHSDCCVSLSPVCGIAYRFGGRRANLPRCRC